MSYVMGIDIGSTSLKAILYDQSGNAVASASRPTEKFHPNPAHPEWVVWQPEQIWNGCAEAIKEAVEKLGKPSEIKGVAVTGMGMDGVPVDEKGDWLYPFISWHDPRTMPQLEWWEKNISAEKTFATGGNVLWPFSTALRLLWMAEHEPEILKRTEKWLLIEDFVNFMLCGVHATDYSMASCTLLFDQHTLDWSDEMLRAAGIDRNLMCHAHPSGAVLGEIHEAAANATGLLAGTPVVLGGHDYLCGALPVGAFKPGVVLDVTGTWEVIMSAIPKPVLTPQVQRTGITVEAHVARGIYAAWGGSAASEMVEWFKKEYGLFAEIEAKQKGVSEWDCLMQSAAASPPGAKGAFFLPHMSATGCPVVDAKSLGAFVGLNSSATHGDMLRAIIEGLDYQFLDVVLAMEAGLGASFEKIIAVGGAIRNEFWMQNKADVVGRPIEVPEVEEATPLGAALLAGIGVGLYKDEQDAYHQVHKPARVLDPDLKEHEQYLKRFAVYKQLYPALKEINHQITQMDS